MKLYRLLDGFSVKASRGHDYCRSHWQYCFDVLQDWGLHAAAIVFKNTRHEQDWFSQRFLRVHCQLFIRQESHVFSSAITKFIFFWFKPFLIYLNASILLRYPPSPKHVQRTVPWGWGFGPACTVLGVLSSVPYLYFTKFPAQVVTSWKFISATARILFNTASIQTSDNSPPRSSNITLWKSSTRHESSFVQSM